jgi:hypothetical protein
MTMVSHASSWLIALSRSRISEDAGTIGSRASELPTSIVGAERRRADFVHPGARENARASIDRDNRFAQELLQPAMLYLKHGLALALAVVAACGTTPDERPATIEVISLSILAPTCGQVQCHSTTSKIQGYAFDTFDAARDSLRSLVNPGGNSLLLHVLRADGGERMPPDSPLNDEDIALIEQWIDDGAPGL